MQESDGNITQAEIAQVLYEAGHGYCKTQTAKIVPRFDFYIDRHKSRALCDSTNFFVENLKFLRGSSKLGSSWISQFQPTLHTIIIASTNCFTTVMCAVFSGAGQMWSREKCDELAKEVVEQFDRVPVEIITTASGLMGGK